ncbi:MAG: site-specific integrase, partial [Neisseria sp.]
MQENQDKKSLDGDKDKIRLLPELRGVLLSDLTRDFIHQVVNQKNCSSSTKNRY